MTTPSLSIVIPAYNEQAALAQFFPEVMTFCRQQGWELILVDDGSTDDTYRLFNEAASDDNIAVIRHKVNRGYGGAIKSGIRAAKSDYVATIDADGQHYLEEVKTLFAALLELDADLMIGSRKGLYPTNRYRDLGKRLIRFVATLLLDVHIFDINSGMKICRTDLARRYLGLCPDSMAFSEIFTLVFISRRHRVEEHPIRIKERVAGTSTITTRTAFETTMEILNLVVLFNPMRIFLPISIASILLGVIWGLPIALRGNGISVGAMLAIVTGIIFFFLALLAEQISLIRRDRGN